MSIDHGKVIFKKDKKGNKFLVGGLMILQGILSVALSISLAAHLIWPENAHGASGSPLQIAYEGRLTDSSGNALGGTGTAYCFRFSIYDSASAGNKLWPAGTPSATISTSTDGVFNAVIGQSDSLSSTIFDFSTTSTAYLQVDVSSAAPSCTTGYESLSPRQQLLASPYAMTANNINYLRSDTVNSKAQVGTTGGAGTASPVYLGLDVKNTADYVGQSCSTNGLIWYNSAVSHALICEGGLIQELGTSGTTTIAAITANSGTPASAGTINFSNSNGVTFGINGNTITASVNAGGGAGNTLSYYEDFPFLSGTQTMSAAQSTQILVPFVLPYAVSGSYIRFPVSMSVASTTFGTTANTAFSASIFRTLNVMVYSLGTGASSQSLQSVASGSVNWGQQWSVSMNANGSQYTVTENFTYPKTGGTSNLSTSFALTNTAFQFSTGSLSNFTGMRLLDVPFANSLSAGQYWLAFNQSTTASTNGTNALTNVNIVFSNWGVSQVSNTFGLIGNASAASMYSAGSFTTNAIGTTASIPLANISSIASNPKLYFQIMRVT